VSVWGLLSALIGTTAFVLDKSGSGVEAAVVLETEGRATSAAVIGDHSVLSSLVDRDMAWSTPAAEQFVLLGQPAGRGIEGECNHRATILATAFPDRV
jgi:hypothetical protein